MASVMTKVGDYWSWFVVFVGLLWFLGIPILVAFLDWSTRDSNIEIERLALWTLYAIGAGGLTALAAGDQDIRRAAIVLLSLGIAVNLTTIAVLVDTTTVDMVGPIAGAGTAGGGFLGLLFEEIKSRGQN